MDVNEEIIEQYLKIIKKWFYMTDISFKVPHNYSNIDLLAYAPKTRRYYDIEVKFRSAFTISLTNIKKDKDFAKFINQFLKSERHKEIEKIIGRQNLTKVFITTYKLFGKSKSKREKIEKEFKKRILKNGFKSEIWYFDEILPELVQNTVLNGKYNTELLQTIRLLKTYATSVETKQ